MTGNTPINQEGPISSNVGVLDDHALHACNLGSTTNNAVAPCKAEDSLSPYSPVPGEVANDAYKLYSRFFPSTSIHTSVCLPSSMDINTNSVFAQGGDCKKLLPTEVCRPKPQSRERCAHSAAPPGGGKKLKLTANDEGATSQKGLAVKEEPVFEEPHDTHELSSHGDACLTRVINSTWKGHLGTYKESMLKDFAFLKSSHVQSENTSRLLGSSIPSGPFDHIANSGDVKPIIGLRFSPLPESTQLPASSPTLCAEEPTRHLASKVALWESPVRGNPSVDADWGKFLALSAVPLGNTDKAIMLPFQQRFKNLQVFLKQCDEADPNERLQGLRSLSTASRSGYAVELETRAIRLSLEEGKELKRMRLLNVLGRAPESNLEELGATPQGPRLPVLGAASTLSLAP
ncbi:hypothetical protein L7F22_051688 [Adiantum nelumboides]|nr:hypothetical protein [Adiantum nelumboides]